MTQTKLVMEGISKSFLGVRALKKVNFDLREGEIVSLVGENGAGKSTLINVMTGQFRPDEGTMTLNGEKVSFSSPKDAIARGIGLVPQELNLIPELSVAENIFLGTNIRKKHFPFDLDWREMNERAAKLLDSLGIRLNTKDKVGKMSVANQQLVQIARALAGGANILIFDEPTACLTITETNRLLEIIKQFRADGKSIVFVSHHMDEVMDLSDRVFILRDGELVESIERSEFDLNRFIHGMVGRTVEQAASQVRNVSGDILLKVENLSRTHEFENISFEVKKGEIYGIAGLVGAGRTELVSTIFGDRAAESGQIYFENQPVRFKSPKEAIKAGFGFVPEERRNYGLLPTMNIRENLVIVDLKSMFRFPKLDVKKENQVTDEYVGKFHVKRANNEGLLTKLSGGNQQKVILARWLAIGAKFLILDEPTRGIDILAKAEIHNIMRRCADSGMTLLVVSSEMEELIAVCDRIMIMHEGHCKGIVDAKDVEPHDILRIALS